MVVAAAVMWWGPQLAISGLLAIAGLRLRCRVSVCSRDRVALLACTHADAAICSLWLLTARGGLVQGRALVAATWYLCWGG